MYRVVIIMERGLVGVTSTFSCYSDRVAKASIRMMQPMWSKPISMSRSVDAP